MSREMDMWVRDAQVQQQRYDDERRKTDVELEPLLIKLQVGCVFKLLLLHAALSLVVWGSFVKQNCLNTR